MPYSETTRFKETVTYLENYAASGLSPQIRKDIGTLIDSRFNRTTAQSRASYTQVSASMSVKANIAAGVVKGSSEEREQRRAIVLIWAVLGSMQNVPASTDARRNQGMSLPPGALPAALSEAMKLAGVVASTGGAGHVFNEFSTNPLAFIQRYRIFIFGVTGGSEKFSTTPSGNYRNVLRFHFCYNAQDDRFEILASPYPGHGASHAFDAVSVPALHWSDVPGRGTTLQPTAAAPASYAGLLGTELAGADWMITTQFTGCSFCYAVSGATAYAAHLSPSDGRATSPKPKGMTAKDLAEQAMGIAPHVTGASFANYPGNGPAPFVNVFGNGAGNAHAVAGNGFYPPKNPSAGPGQMKWMSIFGRFHAGAWQIYTQSIDGALAIMEHRQIF